MPLSLSILSSSSPPSSSSTKNRMKARLRCFKSEHSSLHWSWRCALKHYFLVICHSSIFFTIILLSCTYIKGIGSKTGHSIQFHSQLKVWAFACLLPQYFINPSTTNCFLDRRWFPLPRLLENQAEASAVVVCWRGTKMARGCSPYLCLAGYSPPSTIIPNPFNLLFSCFSSAIQFPSDYHFMFIFLISYFFLWT